MATEAFIGAWESQALLCEAQVVCGGEPPEPCAIATLPAEELEAGVKHAHLDLGAIYRCQVAMDQYVACLTPLDCAALQNAEVHCAAVHERYVIDCASFIEALAFLQADGSGGSGGSPAGGGSGGGAPTGGAPTGGGGGASGGAPTSGGGGVVATGGVVGTGGGGGIGGMQGALAEVLCDRAEVCTATWWPQEERAACQAEAAALFGPLIPDPEGASACLSQTPCQDLASGLAERVVECVNLDPGRTECIGPASVEACTFDDVCSEFSCRDVCGAEDLITTGCGPSRAGGDRCLCGP